MSVQYFKNLGKQRIKILMYGAVDAEDNFLEYHGWRKRIMRLIRMKLDIVHKLSTEVLMRAMKFFVHIVRDHVRIERNIILIKQTVYNYGAEPPTRWTNVTIMASQMLFLRCVHRAEDFHK